MMKKMMLTIFLLVMLTGVAGAADYSYTMADNGMTKILEQGDTFTLELTENPSTGFLWVIAPSDATVDKNGNSLSNSLSDGLQLISDETVKTDVLPGAPQNHIWTIKATNIGSQSVNVHYLLRGLESNSNAFTLTINVQTSNSASVPEFPSVAVPVAAILGLVVIFGRKKNMV
jgi:predicted secreted protein